MKKRNLNIVLGFAAAFIFMCGPVEADDCPVVVPQAGGVLSAAAKTPGRPGDFRDAPGVLPADRAVPMKVLRKISVGAVDLKAGCEAAGLEMQGFPNPNLAIDFERRTFKLVKKPAPVLVAALEGMLSSSYNATVKNHAGDGIVEIGFTYSMEPTGAVHHFSEIEVSCIMQEKDALSSGPEICGDFFRVLAFKIKRALRV